MDINNICRTCLDDTNKLIPIFETNVKAAMNCMPPEATLVDMLNIFLSNCIIKNDGLPDKVCVQCLTQIINVFKFKQRCENVDNELRKLFGLKSENHKKFLNLSFDGDVPNIIIERIMDANTIKDEYDYNDIDIEEVISNREKLPVPPLIIFSKTDSPTSSTAITTMTNMSNNNSKVTFSSNTMDEPNNLSPTKLSVTSTSNTASLSKNTNFNYYETCDDIIMDDDVKSEGGGENGIEEIYVTEIADTDVDDDEVNKEEKDKKNTTNDLFDDKTSDDDDDDNNDDNNDNDEFQTTTIENRYKCKACNKLFKAI